LNSAQNGKAIDGLLLVDQVRNGYKQRNWQPGRKEGMREEKFGVASQFG